MGARSAERNLGQDSERRWPRTRWMQAVRTASAARRRSMRLELRMGRAGDASAIACSGVLASSRRLGVKLCMASLEDLRCEVGGVTSKKGTEARRDGSSALIANMG